MNSTPRNESGAEKAQANAPAPTFPLVGLGASSFGDLHLSLLEQFAPPSLVVNAAYDIVHLSEHAGRFLQFAGEPSRNLLQVAHPALRMELQTALSHAAHQHTNVTTPPIPFEEGTARFVTIHVRPARATKEFLLVVFETADTLKSAPAVASEPADALTLHLQEEILHLRQQLSVTVEQHEASVEELKASHEEQQSINEEMRSAAEEPDTSKEELQSTNEELTTVNQELKSNLDELSRANGDLQNLMASTEIGTIFLDRQMRIKRYTPRIRELFNIIPTDVGRPLSDITHKFSHLSFTEDAERILADLSRSEQEVGSNGNLFLARILPYRTPDDYIDGVVLTFIDITERKKAEEALRASEEQFRRAIEEAPIPIIMQAEDGAVLQISRTWTELTGYGAEDLPTFDAWLNLAYGDGANAVRAHMRDLFQGTQRTLNVEFSIRTRDGASRHWSFSASSPGILHDGRRFIVGMAVDITERKHAEEALRESEEQYRLFVTAGSDILYKMSADWSEMRSLEGKGFIADTENPSLSWLEKYIPDSDKPLAQATIAEAIRTKKTFELEHRVVRADGTPGWAFSRAIPLLDERGEIVEWFGAVSDITDRKQAEEALLASEQRARALIENLPGGAAFIVDRDLRYLLAEGEAFTAAGFTPQDFVGKTVFEALPPELAAQYEPMFRKALAGEYFEHEHFAHGHWYLSRGVPLMDSNGAVYSVLTLSYDITRRKQAETGLRESEERLRIAVESADMGTWDWNLLTNEVRWNPRHFTMLGMEPQERPVPAEEFFRYVHPDDRDRIRERVEQSLRDRVVFEAEFRIVRENGEVCWMSGYGNIVEETDGKAARMSGVMLDITRRKDIEEALRLGEERYRLTVENILDYAIYTLDTGGHVTGWSEGARRVKGYEPHEIIGQHFRVFYILEDQASRKPEHEMEHAAATGRKEDESWRVRKDGSRFWGNEITTAIRDEAGVLRGFVKISRDLTERKRSEEERIALEHETTLLTERNRMAQELHDTLAQGFTGIKMQLEMAQVSLEAVPPETKAGLQRVERAKEIANSSHQEARRSIRALRAPLLENSTLPEALERLAGEVSDGIKVEFALEGTPFPLSALVENDLYRIGQEAVTNAIRHSEAKRIVLTLTYFDDQAHLSIVDNGRGFDPSTSRTGFGVTGMQERARRLGADLQITSRPGQGTQINLGYHLPIGQSRSAR